MLYVCPVNKYSSSTVPRFSLQGCRAKRCLGCPETLVPSSVTLPTSKTPSASLNCRGHLHTQPTAPIAGNLRPAPSRDSLGSPCRFGHFDSCATQASPCFPSCTCLWSRDTRTRGRGPGHVRTRYRKSALAVQQSVRQNKLTICQ